MTDVYGALAAIIETPNEIPNAEYISVFFLVGSSVTFTGSSYIKYKLLENENKEEMKLTMKLRTYSAHAVVMYAKETDYSILEVRFMLQVIREDSRKTLVSLRN